MREVTLEALAQQITDYHEEDKRIHAEIKAETTKTNGRVSSLEDGEVEDRVYKTKVDTTLSLIKGLLGGILGVIGAILVGVAISYINSKLHI